jgi:hypothetical protein
MVSLTSYSFLLIVRRLRTTTKYITATPTNKISHTCTKPTVERVSVGIVEPGDAP